jgi:hypothetical protein
MKTQTVSLSCFILGVAVALILGRYSYLPFGSQGLARVNRWTGEAWILQSKEGTNWWFSVGEPWWEAYPEVPSNEPRGQQPVK